MREGRWWARASSPTDANNSSARAQRSVVDTCGSTAMATLSAALKVGIRLNWKMKPIRLPRMSVRVRSRARERSWWSNSTVPAVGVSRAPTSWSRVLYPDPEGPSMEDEFATGDVEVDAVQRHDLGRALTEVAAFDTTELVERRSHGCLARPNLARQSLATVAPLANHRGLPQ